MSGDDMKNLLKIAVTVFALSLMTIVAQAQSGNLKLHFDIPFAFTVENATFPAGNYEITQPARWVLMLRNTTTQSSGFEHARAPQPGKKTDGRIRLLFHRYGNESFLVMVSDGTAASTYELRETDEEMRLANQHPAAQRETVSVLAQSSLGKAARP
jgi:hypothetical protein